MDGFLHFRVLERKSRPISAATDQRPAPVPSGPALVLAPSPYHGARIQPQWRVGPSSEYFNLILISKYNHNK